MNETTTPRLHKKQAGFTLLQLAVVLAATTAVVVVVAPSFIAAQRQRLAMRTVQDVRTLFDAARWYYHHSDTQADLRHWPGREPRSLNCRSNGLDPMSELQKQHLPAGVRASGNAWDDFVISYGRPDLFGSDLPVSCFLVVSVAAHRSSGVRGILRNNLPLPAPVDAAVFSSAIPLPGKEPIFGP